jgi:zinc protease
MNQTEEFRRHPPKPLEVKPLSLPNFFETKLPNGLQIVAVEDSRLPLISCRLVFRTGDAYDPKDLPGLSDVMTEMLSEGTESRTSRQIAEEIASYGATLSASCHADYIVVAASTLSKFSEPVLNLLADIVLNPSFPEEELELIKENTQQALIAQRAQPSFLATERVSKIIYGEHPYSVVSPTPASIDAMARQKLVDHHRSMMVPQNGVLIVVGDIQIDKLNKNIEELFGNWTGTLPVDIRFPSPPLRTNRKLYIVDRPGSAQSNIVIANMGINRSSKDYFPMLVMNTVLGANASSRLFMNLREEKGYTYGAYSSMDARREIGTFRATAEVRGEVTGASLKEFFYEFDRIRKEPVTDKEIADAKSYLTGVFPIRLETQEGLIEQLVQIRIHSLPNDYLQTYCSNVMAITKEEIQRVAKEYVTPDRAAVVIVGDATTVIEQAKPYVQEIEIYDSEGNLK